MRKPASLISTILAAALLGASLACVPPPHTAEPSAADTQPIPELTREVIDERINETRVYDVLPESNVGDPIPWSFDYDEPKEIVVVDKQVNGASATVILDIKTRSAPYAKTQRHLTGHIRTEWRLETGWVLRRWEIVNTENISMKYRDVPKPLTPLPVNGSTP